MIAFSKSDSERDRWCNLGTGRLGSDRRSLELLPDDELDEYTRHLHRADRQ